MSQEILEQTGSKFSLKDKIKAMGPAVVIVGSFLGPGTVTTATRTGAGFGYGLLWTIVFSIIATIILQEMSARLGIITQKELSEHIIDIFEEKPMLKSIAILFVGGAITLGGIAYMSGDLIGTSLGVSNVTGIPTNYVAPIIGVIILFIINMGDVKWLEKILSVLVALMVFVFVVTMVVVKPDLGEMAKGFVPVIPKGGLMNCIALIGTTIVPYNLFIHCSNAKKHWKTPEELELSKWGTYAAITVGGIITASVMITAAAVMKGMPVNSAADMAVQLEPTLGKYSNIFMSVGLFSAGLSSAIVTPLGVSYVLGGLLGWKLDKSDKRFLYTNIGILLLGIIGSATGINPLSIIIAAQALNGIFLPVIVIFLVYITCSEKVLGKYANSPIVKILGILISIITFVLGTSSVLSVIKTLF
ncbi:Nramp family divalent metal transporter [uncultured Ilyobacter sp.]|uniref:Nramp family divalent metal transporter n=1 Tax=uncultured Ilyobacter sp. TaxID=544433 RepID=UPI0029C7B6D5|nr:Nramp family divalent metal transporter [uncultured Ilyobacter sp.]